ncbi:MAG: hypothetical protein WBV94_20620 [Blastocatellia bacterium]
MDDQAIFSAFLNGDSMVSLITRSGKNRADIERAIREGFKSILLDEAGALSDIILRDWTPDQIQVLINKLTSSHPN